MDSLQVPKVLLCSYRHILVLMFCFFSSIPGWRLEVISSQPVFLTNASFGSSKERGRVGGMPSKGKDIPRGRKPAISCCFL